MTRSPLMVSLAICLLCLLLTARAQTPTIPRIALQGGSKARKAFSMTQTRNPNWKWRQIPVTALYAAPFLKHHLRMPEPLKEAVDELQMEVINRTSLVHERANGQTAVGTNGLYTFPVHIGKPAQTFNIMFDTGSGDFWVWSWLMPQTLTNGRNVYNATKSSESDRLTGQSFNVNYAQGSAYGVVWQDTVTVNGEYSIQGNPVECAQNVGGTNLPGLTGVDGIMGLNTWINDSEYPSPQQTWLSFIVDQYLPAPVFTVALVRNGVGTMDFGTIDAKKYTGSLVYTPVVPLPGWAESGYWLVNWSGFSIGKGSFNSTVHQVFVDSGCNLVLLPTSIARKYYAQIRGSWQQTNGFWMFPCAATTPTFTFGLGTSRITIPSNHMVFQVVDGGNCLGAVQEIEEDSYVLIGVPWLEALFVVHDYGAKRLGFALRPSY
ncbi:aspartic peptidase domain-containing protein [Amylocarpus encephaloides]|uniref:Aspartic peptidase domain-containing protein n=1 Tax=Amylocarpus encephaloides TaxID=45428 RepID=A0A9P8C2T3_9HELO|nr:aspartic peptidase domain-containing protein [Amylocarpus encephaloides]